MSFLILATGLGARFILLVLFGLSLWSVAIMFEKRRVLRNISLGKEFTEIKLKVREGDRKALAEWSRAHPSLSAGTLRTLLEGGNLPAEACDRSVRGYLSERKGELEKNLVVLATLGSNAPFLGLFGTVLGIIQAFGVLSSQPSGTASVMASLSEALVATAFGLFVAIPAVVAYNYFSRKLRVGLQEAETLRDYFLARSEKAS